MIQSFKCKETEKIWKGRFSKRFHRNIQQRAFRKLRMLNVSGKLKDLRIPPSNRLESLEDDREGQYSIRINKQWRICFKWNDGNAYEVEIADYH